MNHNKLRQFVASISFVSIGVNFALLNFHFVFWTGMGMFLVFHCLNELEGKKNGA